MAFEHMQYDAINNPFSWDMTPMILISLKEATHKEIKKHYNSRHSLSREFDSIRPSYYFTHGTFKTNPLIEDYKYFLKERGILFIAIKDK